MSTPRRIRLLPGSIRFRLTAFYALLLAVVLATLGFSVHQLTRDRLRHDGETRLKKTAIDIEAAVRENLRQGDVRFVGGQPSLEETSQPFGSFEARGLVVQIVNAHDRVIERSLEAPEDALLSASGSTRGSLLFGNARVRGANWRIVRYPFTAEIATAADEGQSAVVGAVLVGERLYPFYDTLAALRRTLVTTSLAGLALAVAGGWLLADRALRPVDRVTAAARRIAVGDGSAASLSTRLRVPDSGDEIARLSATFNAMLQRLEAAFLAQQRFVADASHELRTPLTAIRGNVEVLSRQLAAERGGQASDDVVAAVADVQRESARMGRLLDDLLLLARSDAPGEGGAAAAPMRQPARPVRLDTLARDAVRTAAPLVTGQRLEVVAPVPVTVAGDADRLLQLVLILLENALRHTPAGPLVAVEVDAPAGAARLVVRDEGEGIAPEHLPHLFDRFYRADGARGRATGGTGLGLAIARAIARAHGGGIEASSAPGSGSTFTVTLPAVPATAAPPLPTGGDQAGRVAPPGVAT